MHLAHLSKSTTVVNVTEGDKEKSSPFPNLFAQAFIQLPKCSFSSLRNIFSLIYFFLKQKKKKAVDPPKNSLGSIRLKIKYNVNFNFNFFKTKTM